MSMPQPRREFSSYDPSCQVFVGNLPKDRDEETLREGLQKALGYYEIMSISIGRGKGFAFVTFANVKSVYAAVDAARTRGVFVCSLRVDVQRNTNRTDSSPKSKASEVPVARQVPVVPEVPVATRRSSPKPSPSTPKLMTPKAKAYIPTKLTELKRKALSASAPRAAVDEGSIRLGSRSIEVSPVPPPALSVSSRQTDTERRLDPKNELLRQQEFLDRYERHEVRDRAARQGLAPSVPPAAGQKSVPAQSEYLKERAALEALKAEVEALKAKIAAVEQVCEVRKVGELSPEAFSNVITRVVEHKSDYKIVQKAKEIRGKFLVNFPKDVEDVYSKQLPDGSWKNDFDKEMSLLDTLSEVKRMLAHLPGELVRGETCYEEEILWMIKRSCPELFARMQHLVDEVGACFLVRANYLVDILM